VFANAIYWVEARDLVKHPAVHRTAPPHPHNEDFLAPNVSRAQSKKSYVEDKRSQNRALAAPQVLSAQLSFTKGTGNKPGHRPVLQPYPSDVMGSWNCDTHKFAWIKISPTRVGATGGHRGGLCPDPVL
jgi:hypothetical protein